MEEIQVEASSPPLATVDQIQRRLIRPSSRQSQSSFPIITSTCSNELGKQSNIDLKTKKTLDDYLDPVLLAKARAQIARKKQKSDRREMKGRKYDQFEFWPVDRLNEVSGTKQRNLEAVAVDLSKDTDFIGDNGFILE